MVNGNMDQREAFLTSINQIDEVNELWIIRVKSVTEQFGKSSLGNELPRDGIDNEVLKQVKKKSLLMNR